MRSYDIYKIKKQYQSFVFGREKHLYDLLISSEQQEVHRKQIHFLCDLLDNETIDRDIIANLGRRFSTLELYEGVYKLTHPVKGSIYLSMSSYSLTVTCDGSRMLDLDLFVALSTANDRFFAVMDDKREWGWLKPVKYTNSRTGGDLLYL